MTEQDRNQIIIDYKASLSELIVNSKPMITMLTMLAEEDYRYAPDIVDLLFSYIKETSTKLPVLYLIDSIIKNVGGDYKRLINISLVNIFATAFKSMDESSRRKMYELRQTWNEVFPASRLYLLDATVKEIDPAWPSAPLQSRYSQPSTSNIHVNPNYKTVTTKQGEHSSYTPKCVKTENFPKVYSTDAKREKRQPSQNKMPKTPIASVSKVTDKIKDRKVHVLEAQPSMDRKNRVSIAPVKLNENIIKNDKGPLSISDAKIFPKHASPSDPRFAKNTVSGGSRDPRLAKMFGRSDLFDSQIDKKLTTIKPVMPAVSSKMAAFMSKVTTTTGGALYPVERKSNQTSQKQVIEPIKSHFHKQKIHTQIEAEIGKEKPKEKEPEKKPKSSSRVEHHRKESKLKSSEITKRDRDEKGLKQEELTKADKLKKSISKIIKNDVVIAPVKEILTKTEVPPEAGIPLVVSTPLAHKEDISGKNKSDDLKPSRIPSKFVGKIPKIGHTEQQKTRDGKSIQSAQVLHPGFVNNEVSKNEERAELLQPKHKPAKEKSTQPLSSVATEGKSNAVINLFGTEDIDLRQLSTPKQYQNTSTQPTVIPNNVITVKGSLEIMQPVVCEFPAEVPLSTVQEHTPITRRSSVSKPNSASWEKFRDKDPKYKEYHKQASIPDKSDGSIMDVDKHDDQMSQKTDNKKFEEKDIPENLEEHEQESDNFFAKELNEQVENNQITTNEYYRCMHDVWQMKERRREETRRQDRSRNERGQWRTSPYHERNTRDETNQNFNYSGHKSGSVWRRGSPLSQNHPEVFHYDEELPGLPGDIIATVNMNLGSRKMIIDKIPREIRSYGDKAIILLNWDDPRLISFQPTSCNVYFEEEDICLNLMTGEGYKEFYVSGNRHQIKMGVPTHELFIDGKGYQCFFGKKPIVIHLDGKNHTVGLSGRPPHVDICEERNISYLAGKIKMTIDGEKAIYLYLDAMPQRFFLSGRILILKFIDSFRAVTINGIKFPVTFDNVPFSIIVRGYRRFLRFQSLPEGIVPGKVVIEGMDKEDLHLIPVYSTNLTPLLPQQHIPLEPIENENRLSLQNNSIAKHALPSDNTTIDHRNPEHFMFSTNHNDVHHPTTTTGGLYQSENAGLSNTSTNSNAPLDMASILSSLVKFGVIKDNSVSNEPNRIENQEENVELVEEETFAELPTTADLWNNKTLKSRNVPLVNKLVKGMQCSSCGLRFTASRASLYSVHLDWHFRSNKKQQHSTKKANYRKFFLTRKEWEVYEEIEDLDERAPSMFEMENEKETENSNDKELEEAIPSVMVSPNNPSLGVCAVCHETFDQYFDDETEDWRYRYAISVEDANYHPGCHADLLKQIEKEQAAEEEKEKKKLELAQQQEAEKEREKEKMELELAQAQEAEKEREEKKRELELAQAQEAEKEREERKKKLELALEQEAEKEREEKKRKLELAREQEAEKEREKKERELQLAQEQEAEKAKRELAQEREAEMEREKEKRVLEQEREAEKEKEKKKMELAQQEAVKEKEKEEKQKELAQQQEAEERENKQLELTQQRAAEKESREKSEYELAQLQEAEEENRQLELIQRQKNERNKIQVGLVQYHKAAKDKQREDQLELAQQESEEEQGKVYNPLKLAHEEPAENEHKNVEKEIRGLISPQKGKTERISSIINSSLSMEKRQKLTSLDKERLNMMEDLRFGENNLKRKLHQTERKKMEVNEEKRIRLTEKIDKEKRKLAEKVKTESKRRKVSSDDIQLKEIVSLNLENVHTISVRTDIQISSINLDNTNVHKQTEVTNNTADTIDIVHSTDSKLMEVDNAYKYSQSTNNILNLENDKQNLDQENSAEIDANSDKSSQLDPHTMISNISSEQLPMTLSSGENDLTTSKSVDIQLNELSHSLNTASTVQLPSFGGIVIKNEPSEIIEDLPPPIPLLLADLPIKMEIFDEPEEVEEVSILEEAIDIEEPESIPPVITNILQSSIDGNTEQSIPMPEQSINSSIPVIRFNVAKRHTDGIPVEKTDITPTKTDPVKEAMEEFVPPPFTFDPAKKPRFVDAELMTYPVNSRGMEVSSLCSIM